MVLFPLHTARFQTRFLEPFFGPALEVLLNFSSGHDTAVLLLLFGRAEITTQRRPSMFLLKADNKEFTHFKTKSLYSGLLSFFFCSSRDKLRFRFSSSFLGPSQLGLVIWKHKQNLVPGS